MTDFCVACGMPLDNPEYIGAQTEAGLFCKFCVKEDGTPKSCQEIFNGGVHFFVQSIPGTSRELAERVTRKNMNRLPYWQDRKDECLTGVQATDAEYQEILNKLHHK